MFELRFAVPAHTTAEAPRLQMRTGATWQNVPYVAVQREEWAQTKHPATELQDRQQAVESAPTAPPPPPAAPAAGQALVDRLMQLADHYAQRTAERELPTGQLYRGIAHRQAAEARQALEKALQRHLAERHAQDEPAAEHASHVGDAVDPDFELLPPICVGKATAGALKDAVVADGVIVQALVRRILCAHMALRGEISSVIDFGAIWTAFEGAGAPAAAKSTIKSMWHEATTAAILAVLEQRGIRDTFQERVQPWLLACFGAEIASDTVERNHRFLEESLELVQSCGCTRDEAHQLVDYVFDRPVGDKTQEAGGVMVTLAALCLAQSLDMHEAGDIELARIWTKVDSIRAKQAAKPKCSPLP